MEPENQKKITKAFGLGILLVVVLTVGLMIGRHMDGNVGLLSLNTASEGLDMDMFWKVLDITKRDFVATEEIEEEELVFGAIKGMVASLGDPGTVFLTPEETESYNSSLRGEFFAGIGAELGYEKGQVIVVSPLEGSPAKEAGIRPGDFILKIDDYEVELSDTVYDVVGKIRGETGTKVILTVLHKGEIKPVEIEIVRGEITIASMTLEYVGKDKDIALLEVSRFTEASFKEWTTGWDKEINEILSSGAKKMILDLRGNPGGFFDAAIYAGNDFLKGDVIIAKEENAKGKIREYKSKGDGRLLGIELIVLVNEGSASASEILAGALQQAERAQVMGEKTFGKGTAQKIYDFPDNSSLHLTILRWLLPDETQISRENPITPDIEVKLTVEDFLEGIDPQLAKAIEMLSK